MQIIRTLESGRELMNEQSMDAPIKLYGDEVEIQVYEEYSLQLSASELVKLQSIIREVHDCGSSLGDYSSKEWQRIKDKIRFLNSADEFDLNESDE